MNRLVSKPSSEVNPSTYFKCFTVVDSNNSKPSQSCWYLWGSFSNNFNNRSIGWFDYKSKNNLRTDA